MVPAVALYFFAEGYNGCCIHGIHTLATMRNIFNELYYFTLNNSQMSFI
jgi:hypothetical protein